MHIENKGSHSFRPAASEEHNEEGDHRNHPGRDFQYGQCDQLRNNEDDPEPDRQAVPVSKLSSEIYVQLGFFPAVGLRHRKGERRVLLADEQRVGIRGAADLVSQIHGLDIGEALGEFSGEKDDEPRDDAYNLGKDPQPVQNYEMRNGKQPIQEGSPSWRPSRAVRR